MCELLGMCFSNPVHPVFAFHGLLNDSWSNADSWGLGYYPHNSKTAQLFKETYASTSCDMAEFLSNYNGLWGDLFIGHIRKSPRRNLAHHNTQPFNRYYASREWLFCHNGTMHNLTRLPGKAYVPVGDTYSEHFFCELLIQLKTNRISPVFQNRYHGFTDIDFSYIYRLLQNINNSNNGSFNCIFTDGVYLFCYRDKKGAGELSYLNWHPFNSSGLRDDDVKIDIQEPQNFTNRGYIISTIPLSGREWTSFKNGEMIVFRNGEIVARHS